MKYTILFICFLGVNSCNFKSTIQGEYRSPCARQNFIVTSIDKIINDPKFYLSKLIEVDGFFKGGIEQSALFINKKGGKSSSALWVEFGVNDSLKEVTTGSGLLSTQEELHKIFNKRIKIRGFFDPTNTGHLNQYFGAITNICYLKIL